MFSALQNTEVNSCIGGRKLISALGGGREGGGDGQVQHGSQRLPTERHRLAVCDVTKQAETRCLSKLCIQDEMTKSQ